MQDTQFSIVIAANNCDLDTPERQAFRALEEVLVLRGYPLIRAGDAESCYRFIAEDSRIGCALISYEMVSGEGTAGSGENDPEWGIVELVEEIHKCNTWIPVFLCVTWRHLIEIPSSLFDDLAGVIYILEDTPDFIAGRLERALCSYQERMLSPFLKELMRYTRDCNYSWHTPGHAGGMAFLKSPVGRQFFQFFGENVFRADLSVSVPELGSLLEHSGVVGDAEAQAARVFGADVTYFVTNGTSTANKIVWHATVSRGDAVLVDRNCHKSIMHAIIMIGARPVYFHSLYNDYGMMGPIPLRAFQPPPPEEGAEESAAPALAVVTNSTYDGLCYDVRKIDAVLPESVRTLHFDEAWYAYARFHELYQGRFGMGLDDNQRMIYATQSTHKVLAAFSQASMIHVKSGGPRRFDSYRFNEAFMMHTSTSPQYSILASLDTAASMMEGAPGRSLLHQALEEAIVFRVMAARARNDLARRKDAWWFSLWQPPRISHYPINELLCADDVWPGVGRREPLIRAGDWMLRPGESWHGFPLEDDDYIMLDPLKVTILTPHPRLEGSAEIPGIPATVVTRFLREQGIVVEKTGLYSFLVLFSIGATRGKAGTLLTALHQFKARYDANTPLREVFPDLCIQYPCYQHLGLRALCDQMHSYLESSHALDWMKRMYDKEELPEMACPPWKAYRALVADKVDRVPLSELYGRISAVMVVPYPPGIPIIMPGERFPDKNGGSPVINYLKFCWEFDRRFPGFEAKIHGLIEAPVRGENGLYVYCLKERAKSKKFKVRGGKHETEE